jgi:hypothetical protein
MVSGFRDKVIAFAGTSDSPPRPAPAATPRPRIEVELGSDELEHILGQWSEDDRNAPTEFVFKVGTHVVGRLEVVSSLFVSHPDPVGGPA